MAEAFKNLINADTVGQAARHLRRAWPGFDAARFEAWRCKAWRRWS
jgi:hypothetical protein